MIMASANDLIVLFLGLEILSIPLYVLAGSHLRRAESQEAALKYFVLGGFSSAVFLYGAALIYGATGSTNLTEITSTSDRTCSSAMVFSLPVLRCCLSVLASRCGGSLPHVDARRLPGLTIAGCRLHGRRRQRSPDSPALLRVLLTAMSTQTLDWRPVVWVLAIASMVVGAILAAVQTDVKRLMAYSSISHAGFILIGLQAATADGTSRCPVLSVCLCPSSCSVASR